MAGTWNGRAACGMPACRPGGGCQAYRRGRKEPVDRLCGNPPGGAVQTLGKDWTQGGEAPSRPAGRMVESKRPDLWHREAQPGRSSMAEQAPSPHPRILYIEDNPESRALVRNVLEARGFDVLEASDGIAGIDLAISAHPDLILCDIEMPGMDGYETATRLRSYRGLDQCPIVVLTSHGDRGLSQIGRAHV